jgi:cadmium resistance protein CadD (predicted permease)
MKKYRSTNEVIFVKLCRLVMLIQSVSAGQLVENKRNRSYLSFLSVTAVTFTNGGDNIGVYVPLFSKYNTGGQISGLIVVFMIMTAIWCMVAYYYVNHPLIASRIRRIGNIVLPFVLIGLGTFILAMLQYLVCHPTTAWV